MKVKPTRASRRFRQQVVSRLRNVLVMELVEKLLEQVEPFVARQLTSVINRKGEETYNVQDLLQSHSRRSHLGFASYLGLKRAAFSLLITGNGRITFLYSNTNKRSCACNQLK